MPNEIAGTEIAPEEAQEQTAPVTPPAADEVTTLRSRNAGLDAKVTELSKTAKEALTRAEAAEARAIELAQAKDGGDAELRALIAAKDAELAAARKEKALAIIQAQYPETFSVLGETAALMSADQLAQAEARFKGVAEAQEEEAPKPIGNNAGRPTGARPTDYASKVAAFKGTALPWDTD